MLKIIGISSILAGLAGMLHQYVLIGVWFQWGQLWHHELLIVGCIISGIGVLIWDMLEHRHS